MQLSARPTPVTFRSAFALMVQYLSLGAALYSFWSIVPFLGGRTDSWLPALAHEVAVLVANVLSPGNTTNALELVLRSFDTHLVGAAFLFLTGLIIWIAGVEIVAVVWKDARTDDAEWGLFLSRLLADFGFGKPVPFAPASPSNDMTDHVIGVNMQPEHLWNMLVGTVTIEPGSTSDAPTRVSRRPMPQRLAELLAVPEEQWTTEDHALVHSIRDLAGVLMRGPLLDNEAAGLGIGIGVTKELLVSLAAFAPANVHDTAGGANPAGPNMRDVMLSSLRVL